MEACLWFQSWLPYFGDRRTDAKPRPWEKRFMMLGKRRTGLVAAAGALGGVLAVTALGGTSSAAASGNDAGDSPTSQAPVPRTGAQEASDARIAITPGQ